MAKYLFMAGAILVLFGSYLVITHANPVVSRTLLSVGICLELVAAFLIVKRLLSRKVI